MNQIKPKINKAGIGKNICIADKHQTGIEQFDIYRHSWPVFI